MSWLSFVFFGGASVPVPVFTADIDGGAMSAALEADDFPPVLTAFDEAVIIASDDAARLTANEQGGGIGNL